MQADATRERMPFGLLSLVAPSSLSPNLRHILLTLSLAD